MLAFFVSCYPYQNVLLLSPPLVWLAFSLARFNHFPGSPAVSDQPSYTISVKCSQAVSGADTAGSAAAYVCRDEAAPPNPFEGVQS